MKPFFKPLILIAAWLSFQTCTTPVNDKKIKTVRAFYYWKNTEFTLSKEENEVLKDLQIQKLYIKFFEVIPDEKFDAIPVAKSSVHLWSFENGPDQDKIYSAIMRNLEVIPTVFIRNDVLQKTTHEILDTLASNITFLIAKYYDDKIHNNPNNYREIQLDCDWTIKTKDNYFYLINAIRQRAGKTISCTLRFYPYKYRDKMGVPPVDKATLMCYNLIGPFSSQKENSIQNNKELESYLKNSEKYPVHLDIALPVFSWMQVYQNDQFSGIINTPDPVLNAALKPFKPLWFEVQRDLVANNIYLRAGDKIKNEDVTEEQTRQTIHLLKKYIAFDDSTTITLFHLDGPTLKNFTHETLDRFYSDFNNQGK
jgi:hypothetical protein